MNLELLEKYLQYRKPKSMEPMKKFAILIPLINRNNRWELVYELRAKHMNTQPGEVSFPGGKMEIGEDFIDCAVRETMEELNIKRENIRILGELDYLISYANMEIHCFLGFIENIKFEDIKPNKEEVDHLFTVDIDYLKKNEPEKYYLELQTISNNEFPYNLIPNGKEYKFRKSKRTIYFYNYRDYIIWGYTATMTKNVIELMREIEIV